MSRQNKNTRNRKLAAQFTELHKKGGKGPASTEATHGKDSRRRWRSIQVAARKAEAAAEAKRVEAAQKAKTEKDKAAKPTKSAKNEPKLDVVLAKKFEGSDAGKKPVKGKRVQAA